MVHWAENIHKLEHLFAFFDVCQRLHNGNILDRSGAAQRCESVLTAWKVAQFGFSSAQKAAQFDLSSVRLPSADRNRKLVAFLDVLESLNQKVRSRPPCGVPAEQPFVFNRNSSMLNPLGLGLQGLLVDHVYTAQKEQIEAALHACGVDRPAVVADCAFGLERQLAAGRVAVGQQDFAAAIEILEGQLELGHIYLRQELAQALAETRAAAARQSVDQNIAKLKYEEGRRAFAEKRYTAASQLYESALLLHPNDDGTVAEVRKALEVSQTKMKGLQEAAIKKIGLLLDKKENISIAAMKMIRLNVQRKKKARWEKADADKRERAAAARAEGEMMAERVKELLAVDPPDYQNPELLEYIQILRSQTHACAALCGSPWQDWQESGACQVCHAIVDVREQGQQCEKQGHWICWVCMIAHIDWLELAGDGEVAAKVATPRRRAEPKPVEVDAAAVLAKAEAVEEAARAAEATKEEAAAAAAEAARFAVAAVEAARAAAEFTAATAAEAVAAVVAVEPVPPPPSDRFFASLGNALRYDMEEGRFFVWTGLPDESEARVEPAADDGQEGAAATRIQTRYRGRAVRRLVPENEVVERAEAEAPFLKELVLAEAARELAESEAVKAEAAKEEVEVRAAGKALGTSCKRS